MWVGAGGELTRKPVRKWNNDNVMEWVEGLGEWAQHNCSEIFRKEVREKEEEGEGGREGKTKARDSTSKQLFVFDVP